MSWIPNGGRLLVLGLAGGTATVWTYRRSKRDLTHDKDGAENQMPKFGTSRGSFQSSLPLGKVLASWTTNFEPTVKWDSNWDRREPEDLVKPAKSTEDKDAKDRANEVEKKKPKATRHLFLIRHGQYVMDSDNDVDRVLTKLGREQAELTGLRLKNLDFPYDKLINSTMTRATETSDIIHTFLPELPRQSCDLLREGAPIPPEPPIGHWRPNKNFYEDGARIEAAFRKYFHRASSEQTKDSYEVIVCHANVIRYFVCRALQFPPEAWLRMSLYNSSITYMLIRPSGRVAIKGLGDAGHIPPEKLTTT